MMCKYQIKSKWNGGDSGDEGDDLLLKEIERIESERIPEVTSAEMQNRDNDNCMRSIRQGMHHYLDLCLHVQYVYQQTSALNEIVQTLTEECAKSKPDKSVMKVFPSVDPSDRVCVYVHGTCLTKVNNALQHRALSIFLLRKKKIKIYIKFFKM